VRFRAPRLVQEALYAAVQEALRSTRVVSPQAGLTAWTSDGGAAVPAARDTLTAEAPAPGAAWLTGADDPPADAQPGLFREADAPFGAPRFGAVIGQLHETFVVAANDDEVFFVDQHVAHERVLFERLEQEMEARALPSQELLFPQPLDLAPGQADLLLEWAPALGQLGFALEGFGGSTLLLRAVPALLKGEEPRRLIDGLLDEVGGGARDQTAPVIHRALSFVACRAAVKANERLEHGEMTRLLGDLSGTRTPYFCPHGRPIVSRLSLREIRRELGRTW
jgi:DNA mismatch repair protein MutL